MGNTIRHTLSHMCGGESSKEVQDVDRPIERPKESKKKKSKKSKKNKKVRDDKLGAIEEENEGQNLTEPNENNVAPVQVGGQEKSKEGLSNKSHKHGDDSAEERRDKEELVSSGELSTVPLITIDCASDTASDEVSCVEEEDGDSISLISSNQEDALKTSIIVSSFIPMKCEILGIEEADKIFETASAAYVPFIERGSRLQDAILEFQQCVDVEKKVTDLLTLWQLYKDMLTEEADTEIPVDKMDAIKDIEAMKVAALALLQIIECVKPVLNKCAEDAKNIDVIQCTKDKIREGDEVMSTGKFSPPGKHRRNMTRLKKCTHQITEIELETDGILYYIQEYLSECGHRTEKIDDSPLLIRESIIYPEERIPDEAYNDFDDMFYSLSHESVPLVTSDCECDEDYFNDRPRTPLPPADLRATPDQHLSKVSYDSLSDLEADVYIKVYYESDECSRSSLQVSTEISSNTKLDNELISANVQVPVCTVAQVNDMYALPQVYLEEAPEDESSMDIEGPITGNECYEAIEAECFVESTSEVECIPDLPNLENESNSCVEKTNSSESLSSNSCDHSMDECDPNVNIVSIQHSTPPLSKKDYEPFTMNVDVINTDNEIPPETNGDTSPYDVIVTSQSTSYIPVTCLDESISLNNGVLFKGGNKFSYVVDITPSNEHPELVNNNKCIDMEVVDGDVLEHSYDEDTYRVSSSIDNVEMSDLGHLESKNQDGNISKNESFVELESEQEPKHTTNLSDTEPDNTLEDNEIIHVNIVELESNDTNKCFDEPDDLYHLPDQIVTVISHVPNNQDSHIRKNVSFVELESEQEIMHTTNLSDTEPDNTFEDNEITHVHIVELESNDTNKCFGETGDLYHLPDTGDQIVPIISLESKNQDIDISKNDPFFEFETEQEIMHTTNFSHIESNNTSEDNEITHVNIVELESNKCFGETDNLYHHFDMADQIEPIISLECKNQGNDISKNDSFVELEPEQETKHPINLSEIDFDNASDDNEITHVNIAELESIDTDICFGETDDIFLHSNDNSSQNEIIVHDVFEVEETTEICLVDDVPVNNESDFPRISNPDVIYVEHDHGDDSDFESGSNATSIQEIEIFPVNKPRENSINVNNSEETRLHSESNASNVREDKVDVALLALKKGIGNDNVQDEFVDLICSSISQVLDDDGKLPAIRLPSLESSHEETAIQKSFQHSKEVLDWVGTHFNDESSNYDKENNISEQCIFVPVKKDSLHSPHILSHTILKSDNQVRQPARLDDEHIRTVSVSTEDLIADDPTNYNIPEEQTFVIKSLSEGVNNAFSQLTSTPRRCHTPPLMLDPEPDHNTLDYGNYVFIDPSTGDIQIMRNRSRSLDSLVSMASSRSSISRFGSFEFVTDFEINIAEKNQEMMNAK